MRIDNYLYPMPLNIKAINWSVEESAWQKILMNRQNNGGQGGVINLATNFIVYFSGFTSEKFIGSI